MNEEINVTNFDDNEVCCPFCKEELAGVSSLEGRTGPTSDGRSISVCSDCAMVSVFDNKEDGTSLCLRKLTEKEWTEMIEDKEGYKKLESYQAAVKKLNKDTTEPDTSTLDALMD